MSPAIAPNGDADAATLPMIRDVGSIEGSPPSRHSLGETNAAAPLLRHVGIAADPVGRVVTFEHPDLMIRLRALRVAYRAERLAAGNALAAYLCGDHVLRRFLGLRGRSPARPRSRRARTWLQPFIGRLPSQPIQIRTIQTKRAANRFSTARSRSSQIAPAPMSGAWNRFRPPFSVL
jgi:hypothetical protein